MQRFLLTVFTASLCFLSSCAPLTSFFTPNDFEIKIENDGVVIVKFLNDETESVVIPKKSPVARSLESAKARFTVASR